MTEDKTIYVLTGAYDAGKSATLNFLKHAFGYYVQEEAFKIIQQEVGLGPFFHDPNEPYVENHSPTHVCPRCKPKELTKLILEKQLELEKNCTQNITIFERGFCDSIAYLRWLGINEFSGLNFNPADFARYRLVFLLEIMAELQEPKWGFSKEERTEKATRFNELTLCEYVNAGYRVIIIPPGTVKTRASIINEIIRDTKTDPPHFYIVDYRGDYGGLLSEVNGFLKKKGLYSSSLLYRITGEKHLEKVLLYGTDRAGFANEMRWEEKGYIGRPRKFEDIIYASTEKEILEGTDTKNLSTSFKKISVTPSPYLLVYDARKFELVHCDHQYAFKDASNKKEALLAILKIKTAR